MRFQLTLLGAKQALTLGKGLTVNSSSCLVLAVFTDNLELRVATARGYGPRNVNKMLSYRRDRAAVCVIVFAKRRRLELGDNILRTV